MRVTPSEVRRIAMWSGPRNISTAMMRSWENRNDTSVVDEPFYACYLKTANVIHPMQDQVLAEQSSNWQEVVADVLLSPLPEGTSIQYQKHMTQHMVNDLDMDWFNTLSHAFLIRHPAEVVASYGAKRGSVTAADVGFELQHRLFQLVANSGIKNIPVIDAKDVLTNPKQMLTKLCKALAVPFSNAMLKWPAGPRESDGVWAQHWYQNVEKSTGFAPYKEKAIELGSDHRKVVDECLPYYEAMYSQRLRLDD